MSLVQLQAELSKLSPQEQLVLADFLVMHAEKDRPQDTEYTCMGRRGGGNTRTHKHRDTVTHQGGGTVAHWGGGGGLASTFRAW